ncbi:MAG: InlB B-repeat-containing protein, partial [Paludibacteraceae bacterium]|nr:InlB B-repeat-containing protein [Paludibacteraceae bacterium]
MKRTTMFRTGMLVALLLLFAGGVMAQSELNVVFGTGTNTTNTQYYTSTPSKLNDYLSFSAKKNSGTSEPSYQSGGPDFRLYRNNNSPYNGASLTITATNDATITSVVFTTSTNPTSKYQIDEGDLKSVEFSASSPYTVTLSELSAKTVTLQNYTSEKTQLQVKSIKITYTLPSSDFTLTAGTSVNGKTEIEGKKVIFTPDPGYKFGSIDVVPVGAATLTRLSDEDGVYTYSVEATEDCTITGTFEAIPLKNVKFDAGTGTAVDDIKETLGGQGITLPSTTPSTMCGNEGWTFAGWATEAVSEGNTPAALYSEGDKYIPTADNQTLYAVYQLGTADVDKITVKSSGFLTTTSSSYTAYEDKTIDGIKFTVDKAILNASYIQLNNNTNGGNGALYNTDAISTIKTLKINFASNTTSAEVKLLAGKSKLNGSAGTAYASLNGAIDGAKNATASGSITYDLSSGGYSYFLLKVKGATYISSIEIEYGVSATYNSNPS